MRGSVENKYCLWSCILSLCVFCSLTFPCVSQKQYKFHWPIDSPFVITGNYGELRPNHFHAGIDFSTGGKINLPVYCVEEGYISRIRISPYGYGKCVYVTHPGGKVTVYAHLNSFSLKVDRLAKAFCHDTQSNEIDYMPSPRSAYVRKNEILGLSGNSGGSTGPHLHFEIRDEVSEVPLNPLGFYRLNDNMPPEIFSLAVYDLHDTLQPVMLDTYKVKKGRNDSLILSEDQLILNSSCVGFAFSGCDRYYANGNPNNIYSIRIYLDDTLIYVHRLNNIAFSETRFVNEFNESLGKIKYQKCFLPTLFPPELFGIYSNKGRVVLGTDRFRKIKLIAIDEAGNSSALQFHIRARTGFVANINNTLPDSLTNCNQDAQIHADGLDLRIPAKTLYRSAKINVKSTVEKDGKFSISPDLNLRQAATVALKVPLFLKNLGTKILLKGSSSVVPVNRNDSLFFGIKDFGKYYLVIDTTAPKVRVGYSERSLRNAWQMDAFSFEITDVSSGMGKYNLWLNNAWVFSEYDAKTDLLTYYFDEDTPIGLLQFKLEVEDKLGNKTLFEYTLKK